MANVSILLATYQGQRFLHEQLESIKKQTHRHWSLYISDDGSRDDTIQIASDFSLASDNLVQIMRGPGQGFLRNFMHLLSSVPLDAEYYAFCDQDDRWHPDKLERAIGWLESQKSRQPRLYCSRTRNIDENNNEIGLSPLFKKKPCFSNALVQSIAGGNTMVFDRKSVEIIRECGVSHQLPSHDWWLYILITGAGGNIKYDKNPTVDYRQHDNNLVGSNSSARARIRRLKLLCDGRFRQWNEQHVHALDSCLNFLTLENKNTYGLFKAMRDRGFPFNLKHLLAGGLHRQTLSGNIGLLIGVLFRRA